MPTELYGSGTIPKTGDSERMLMVKELQSTNSGGGGGGGMTCIIGGIGPPTGAPPCTWSMYVEQPVLPQTTPGIWINVGSTWFNSIGTGPQ